LLDMQSHNRNFFFFVTLHSMENPFDNFACPIGLDAHLICGYSL
jgi:hypothetical protein